MIKHIYTAAYDDGCYSVEFEVNNNDRIMLVIEDETLAGEAAATLQATFRLVEEQAKFFSLPHLIDEDKDVQEAINLILESDNWCTIWYPEDDAVIQKVYDRLVAMGLKDYVENYDEDTEEPGLFMYAGLREKFNFSDSPNKPGIDLDLFIKQRNSLVDLAVLLTNAKWDTNTPVTAAWFATKTDQEITNLIKNVINLPNKEVNNE